MTEGVYEPAQLAYGSKYSDGKEVQADPETRATDGSFQQVEKRYNPHRGGMRLRELPKPTPVQ